MNVDDRELKKSIMDEDPCIKEEVFDETSVPQNIYRFVTVSSPSAHDILPVPIKEELKVTVKGQAVVESKTSAEYPCENCDKVFRHKCDVERHQISHTKIKQFPCEKCGKYFAYKNDVKRHIIKQHTDNPPKQPHLIYSECGKSFTNKTNFDIHQRTHTGEMPFECELCNDNFQHERHLEKHRVNAHSKPYPNICELCGKGFINFRFKEAWETHKKYCGKERKTRCDICCKNFKKTDGYNRHMKSHAKQRDFHCI